MDNENGYFNLGDDLKGVFRGSGVKEKLLHGGSLTAKLGYNVVRYGIKEGPRNIEDRKAAMEREEAKKKK